LLLPESSKNKPTKGWMNAEGQSMGHY